MWDIIKDKVDAGEGMSEGNKKKVVTPLDSWP
jgi:hypothetical protein